MGMDSRTLQMFRETVKGFRKIDDAKIDALADCAEKRFYRKHDFFSSPQNPSPYVGFMERGLFRRYIIDKDGNEITYNFIVANGGRECNVFSAYAAIIMNIQQPGCVQALEDAELYVMHRDRFAEFWAADEDWKAWLQIVTECIFVNTRRREEGLLMYDAKGRYEKFIKESSGWADRVQLAHIASYLGISPVSLSRLRKNMQD